MEIGIRTETHDIRSGETHHTNTSYFTMVAIGEDGKSTAVPGLILQTHEDVRRFLEGMARRKMKHVIIIISRCWTHIDRTKRINYKFDINIPLLRPKAGYRFNYVTVLWCKAYCGIEKLTFIICWLFEGRDG